MYWGYKLRYLIKSAMKRSSKGTYLKVHAVKLGLLRRVSCEKGYWSIFYFHQSLQVYPQTYLWVIKFCSPPCVETQALWLQGGRADIDCPPFISPTHPPLHTCCAVASFRAGPSPVQVASLARNVGIVEGYRCLTDAAQLWSPFQYAKYYNQNSDGDLQQFRLVWMCRSMC